MSLELKIEALTSAVVALTERMSALEPVTQAPTKAKTAAKKEPVQTVTSATAEAVSIEDLQDLCMSIVRKDRTKKNAIKDAISAFGGAATLNDVNAADYQALQEALGALQ